MKVALFILAYIAAAGCTPIGRSNSLQYYDRECNCSIENYWFDAVVVIDNSAGMTQDGLTQVIASFTSLFTESRFANSSDPRNIRVGIVTYNTAYKIEADLNRFSSVDDMMQSAFSIQISSNENSYLMQGLSGAEKILEAGRQGNVRNNYQQVVIVYASEYRGVGELDPVPAAERLKANGVTLITVAYKQNSDESSIMKIGELASPGDNFTNSDMNLEGEIHTALCQANCFCPNLWSQYTSDINVASAQKYGVCLKVAEMPASWISAKYACQTMVKGGHLVTEFNNQKHEFVRQLFINDKVQSEPYIYHIGLKLNDGKYFWEQGANTQTIQIQSDYTKWNPGNPSNDSTQACVLNEQIGSNTEIGWQSENCYKVTKNYVCESISCDTENYCP